MSANSTIQWGCSPGSVFNTSTKRISYGPSNDVKGFGVPLGIAKSLWPSGRRLPGTPELPWEVLRPRQTMLIHDPLKPVRAVVYEDFRKALKSLTKILYLDNTSAESANLRQDFDNMWSHGATPADASSCEIFTNSARPGLQADVAVTLALRMTNFTNLPPWLKGTPEEAVLRSLDPAGQGTAWRVVTDLIVRNNWEEKLAASFFDQLPESEKYKVVYAFIESATQGSDPSILYDGVTLPVFYTFGLLITCDVLLHAGITAGWGEAGKNLVRSLLPSVRARVERAAARPSVNKSAPAARPSVNKSAPAARPSVNKSAPAARPSGKRIISEREWTAKAPSRKLAEVDKSNATTAEAPPAGQKNRTLILAALAVALTAAGAWVYTRRRRR